MTVSPSLHGVSALARLRRRLFGCYRTAVVALGLLALDAGSAEPLTSVADLRYGVALYHYYQGDNLDALSELMVAQQRGGIQGHGSNPEIMEGGFSMAYGMERKASDIFSRLLDANRPQRTRDAAWFYLAQMRYLRGDGEAAAQALDKIGDQPELALQPEVAALRFNVALQQNRLEDAAAIFNQRGPMAGWRPYMQFNLGAAHSRAGEYAEGVNYFTDLVNMRERSEEHLALYDKAMTAAGYAHLLQKNYTQAIESFTQVRLTSPLSSRALLGYGWAAVEQGDYRLALKPWQALAKQPLVDQFTQEALVAIPYAYEKMGLPAEALEQFRQAEASYLTEIERLDEALDDVEGYAIRDALKLDLSTDFSWLDYAQENQLAPQMSYLVSLFSREEFIGLVQEVRDLLAIQNQFAQWQNALDFYSQMLNEREVNRAREVDYLAQRELDQQIATMTDLRDDFAERIQELQQQTDFLVLVDPADSARLERIVRAEKNIQTLQAAARDYSIQVMPREELAQLAENLRRQKGLMLWHAAQMYDERLWRAESELAQVDEHLQSLLARQQRIAKIVDQGYDLQPYRQRIARANQQLIRQTLDIDYAIERAQDVLRGQVTRELQIQRGRMYHYLGQARMAIARLLDASSSDSQSPSPQALRANDGGEP